MDSESTPEDHKTAADVAYQAVDSVEVEAAKTCNHLRRGIIGVLIGTGMIGALQWFAPSFDHQVANMISILVGVVTALFAIYQLLRWAGQHGQRLAVTATLLLALAGTSAVFQFEGFSGEMLPQFKSRFASPPPELRSLSDTAASPESFDSDGEDTRAESASGNVVAEVDSIGFLGSQRIGVIASRSFAIPARESDIEVLWDQGIGEGWSSFAVSGDHAVTLEQRDELECVTCYRLTDGKLLWIKSHEARHQNSLGGIGPRSTPSIMGDRVYAQGATGQIWCLDLNTGETLWSVDLLELADWDQATSELAISWGRATSPLIVDGLCIIPYGGPDENQETGRSLIAFDAESGAPRWTSGEDQISYGSPGLLTLGGTRQIVSVNEKTITGHNIKDGKLLWEFEWPGQSNGGANCAMVIPAGKDQFLIGKGYGGGSALVQVTARNDGMLSAAAAWHSSRLLKTKFTHACVDGDVAFAISNGYLEAVAIQDAQQLWVQPRRTRFGQGQILLVEDTIVAQSESGEVVFVAADRTEYRELAHLPAMDSKTWNIPTVAGRYLLVRNDRQAVCYLLPERSGDD